LDLDRRVQLEQPLGDGSTYGKPTPTLNNVDDSIRAVDHEPAHINSAAPQMPEEATGNDFAIGSKHHLDPASERAVPSL
jgi:hypothetical protein